MNWKDDNDDDDDDEDEWNLIHIINKILVHWIQYMYKWYGIIVHWVWQLSDKNSVKLAIFVPGKLLCRYLLRFIFFRLHPILAQFRCRKKMVVDDVVMYHISPKIQFFSSLQAPKIFHFIAKEFHLLKCISISILCSHLIEQTVIIKWANEMCYSSIIQYNWLVLDPIYRTMIWKCLCMAM